jgi:hypothetical protein
MPEDARRSRREEIASKPFMAASHREDRASNVLEYIAIYLENIEAHLKRIADRLDEAEFRGCGRKSQPLPLLIRQIIPPLERI